MRSKSLLLATLILAVAVAGCTSIGPQPTPVAPTKTPKPTFTATPDWTPTPVVFATEAPVAAEPTAEAAAPAQPEATAGPEATEAPTDETPTAEPPAAGANQVARLTANQTVNVRGGPGTNYPVIGRLSAGQAYPVTGKNARGDWYQFDLDGKSAWVIANLVNVSGDPAAMPGGAEHPGGAHRAPNGAAAAPTDITAASTALSHNRRQCQPGAMSTMLQSSSKCERQPAGNWFDGTVYKGGTAVQRCACASSATRLWPPSPTRRSAVRMTGYPGWNTGYCSHIIHASGPEAGNGTVWIVDVATARASPKWRTGTPRTLVKAC